MATALSGAELEVLSDAGELQASWAARPIELIDRRGQQPPWMEDPGGQILATLVGHTVPHVGAERALLIVRRADETRIEAEATTQPDTIVVRRLDTLPGPSDLPDTVLRYVLRTREVVMLEDAGVPNPFSTDPYVIEHGVRSLLCLPLVKQGTLIGALYFENRVASHVFTPPRVGLLKLLVSQAVSLENAHLYTELRHAQATLASGESLEGAIRFAQGAGRHGAAAPIANDSPPPPNHRRHSARHHHPGAGWQHAQRERVRPRLHRAQPRGGKSRRFSCPPFPPG